MDRATFARRLAEAAEHARAFGASCLVDAVPERIVLRVRLDASHDAGCRLDERVYPEDDARAPFECTCEALAEELYRDGRIPEWIDLALDDIRADAAVIAATVLKAARPRLRVRTRPVRP